MRALKITLTIGTIILLGACAKKKYPESVTEDKPAFYSSFNVGSGNISLGAGIDGYKMYSSYEHKQNGIYSLVSEIRSGNCGSNCPNSIKIEISDTKVSSPGSPINISSAVYPGAFGYFSPEVKVEFISYYNKQASSYRWDFGDGSPASTLADPTHTYKKGGTYNVCLTISSADGCESTICNSLKVGYQQGTCFTSIKAESTSANSVTFRQTTLGKPNFDYFWEFGDGTTSTEPNPVHNYSITGAYPARLKVIDDNKDISYASYNVVTANDPSSCSANMELDSVGYVINSLSFSEVTISYTDPSGVVYRSNQNFQPSTSKFEILSVEDFENNENGEATKKLHVKFNCKLYNGAKSMLMENAEAIICVAYKK